MDWHAGRTLPCPKWAEGGGQGAAAEQGKWEPPLQDIGSPHVEAMGRKACRTPWQCTHDIVKLNGKSGKVWLEFNWAIRTNITGSPQTCPWLPCRKSGKNIRSTPGPGGGSPSSYGVSSSPATEKSEFHARCKS